MQIIFGRTFFAAIFLAIWIFFTQKNFRPPAKKYFWQFFAAGIILAAHWITFFWSIQISTVAIGVLTFSTFPIFTTFLEPLFFREKLKFTDAVSAFFAFAGVAIIVPDFDFSNATFRGAIFGIISGFLFSILAILNRKLVQKFSSLQISFWENFFATFALFPILFFAEIKLQFEDFLLLILLGTVFTAVAHTFFIKSLEKIRAQTAAIISNLEPVYGILFAIFLVGEIPNLQTCVGGALILGVVFWRTIFKI